MEKWQNGFCDKFRNCSKSLIPQSHSGNAAIRQEFSRGGTATVPLWIFAVLRQCRYKKVAVLPQCRYGAGIYIHVRVEQYCHSAVAVLAYRVLPQCRCSAGYNIWYSKLRDNSSILNRNSLGGSTAFWKNGFLPGCQTAALVQFYFNIFNILMLFYWRFLTKKISLYRFFLLPLYCQWLNSQRQLILLTFINNLKILVLWQKNLKFHVLSRTKLIY